MNLACPCDRTQNRAVGATSCRPKDPNSTGEHIVTAETASTTSRGTDHSPLEEVALAIYESLSHHMPHDEQAPCERFNSIDALMAISESLDGIADSIGNYTEVYAAVNGWGRAQHAPNELSDQLEAHNLAVIPQRTRRSH
jgi:hypothetical protein